MDRVSRLTIGTRFAEKYLVRELLWESLDGACYRVRAEGEEVDRTLRLLPMRITPEIATVLLDSAFQIEAIGHPAIVPTTTYSTGAELNGSWLVSAPVAGMPLDEFLRREGELDPDVARSLCLAIGEVLAAAHARGLHHGSLRPRNLWIDTAGTEDGQPRIILTECGLAPILHQAARRKGQRTGALQWLAPEQIRGARGGAPADVWSFALLVFRLLCGRSFWRGASSQPPHPAAILSEQSRPLRVRATARAMEYERAERLPARFDRWFAACTSSFPSRRFRNLVQALPPLRQLFASSAKAAEPAPVACSAEQAPDAHAAAADTARGAATGRRRRPWRRLLACVLAGLGALSGTCTLLQVTATRPAFFLTADEADRFAQTTELPLSQSWLRPSLELPIPIGALLVTSARSEEPAERPALPVREPRAGGCASLPDCLRRTKELLAGSPHSIQPEEAVARMRKACSQRNPAACYLLAQLIERGFGAASDRTEGFMLLDRACSGHEQRACQELLTWLERRCEQRNPAACTLLGVRYLRGQGTARDLVRARACFLRGCQLRERGACERLSLLDSLAPTSEI